MRCSMGLLQGWRGWVDGVWEFNGEDEDVSGFLVLLLNTC